jgi:hypothetical protein
MSKLISVTTQEPYQLILQYEDGVSGVYDCSQLVWKWVFKAFNDSHFFKKAFVAYNWDAIAWDENLDIDSENCYLSITWSH